MLSRSSAVDPNYACPFFCIHGKKPRVTTPKNTQNGQEAYRANELWTRLTNSKLLMASPRNAGVKDMVKSLKCCRFSPRSAPSILLTMFNKATLAQALPAVCPEYQPLIISLESSTRVCLPDWQTKALGGSLLPVSLDHPLASETGRSSRKRVY